jgi:hypothetical protein
MRPSPRTLSVKHEAAAMADRLHALRRRPAGVRAVVAILFMLGAFGPVAAKSDGLAEVLTGGATREWVKELGGVFLGDPAISCTGGEAWTFNADGSGSQILCEDRQRKLSPFEWELRVEPDGKTVLTIADREFVLDIRERPSGLAGEPTILVAILRTRRIDQGTPVEEIRLEFWER